MYRFVQDIQKRRDDMTARRAAAEMNRSPMSHAAVPRNSETSVLMRLTVVTFVGVLSYVAYYYMRYGTAGKYDWLGTS